MDHGTNAYDILTGKVYPLKLGFIGVVNRSQQDITTNKPLDESLRSEEEFFQNHPAYKTIATKCGTNYLAKTLNQILMNHIRERLPDIKAKLNTLMGQTEQELATYGDSNIVSKEDRGSIILTLMNKFASSFINSIEGNSSDISTKELCGGARIYYIYNDVLSQSLRSINPVSNLTVQDIRTAVRNSTGPRPSLFVPELAFDMLVKPQIKLLEGPSHRCVELVYEELMKICHNCGSHELSRYPKLQTKLVEVVSELLRERLGPTTKYVESMIEIHRAYINTNHPNFIGAAAAMTLVVEEKKKQQLLDRPNSLKTQISSTELKKSKSTNGENGHSHRSTESTSTLDEVNKLERSKSSIVTANGSAHGEKDTFLNFFFGKDDKPSRPLKQEQPKAFSYPKESEVLQFNVPGQQNSFEQKMDQLDLDDPEQLSEREQLECELIRRLIISYFGIVREMIEDQVPKAVMFLLVNHCKEKVQNALVQKLYKESLFDELLYEDQNLIAEREKCIKLLETYKEAAKVISEVV
ncbi:unnamed protein product [Ambrosiozyma monospora]|uniref:dynamin GTPase n=1 Tax=Ambrosiozyma monospora TaxID=43982 RepID=A0A9W6YQT9_AMBMO|nr:unnamed protein product [Ambrosiozyma monospora]